MMIRFDSHAYWIQTVLKFITAAWMHRNGLPVNTLFLDWWSLKMSRSPIGPRHQLPMACLCLAIIGTLPRSRISHADELIIGRMPSSILYDRRARVATSIWGRRHATYGSNSMKLPSRVIWYSFELDIDKVKTRCIRSCLRMAENFISLSVVSLISQLPPTSPLKRLIREDWPVITNGDLPTRFGASAAWFSAFCIRYSSRLGRQLRRACTPPYRQPEYHFSI